MMRVAVCNNMVSPYTNRLFNYIEDRGIDLHVISCTLREKNRGWSGNYAKKYEHVVLKGIQYRITGSRIIHLNWGMWRTLSRLQPELVTINGLYPTMLIAAFWSLIHRTPMAFLTDGWRLTMPQSILHRVVRPFIVARSRAIICTSEKGRRFFTEEGVDSKRVFVSHLVPAWDSPAELADFDQRPYHLLWCSRLDDPDKNPSFFVDLATSLNKRISDLRVRVVGDGPLRQKMLDDLSRAGVNFDYLAYVPPEEIAEIFASARMLVLPSKREPWGLVCNEAMQCGTPCLVSPFTGVADELVINGQSGFVRDLDTQQWEDAVATTILNRTTWVEMSKAAIGSVGRYDLESSGNKYIEGFTFAMREAAVEQ
jgi:glycosyltransferase involved in cell wall biosynthesis